MPHGSVLKAEIAALGLSPEDVLDFSVNTNPLGPAASVVRAIGEAEWSRYPGDDAPTLRQALAEHAGVATNQVVLGNCSIELVWLIAMASLEAGDHALVIGPTFGEYARAVRVARGVVDQTPASATAPRLVFVCNPNNPTGHYRCRAEIEAVVATGALCVIDEAYAPFVDDRWDGRPLLEHGNVVILRSMTKDHALPGLRLGYALAPPGVARALEAVKPPWNVNAGALRAGLAALEPEAQRHVAAGRAVVREGRKVLTEGFTRLGFLVSPSAANFVLVEVGDGAAFRRALLPHGLVVRDCASFGLPRCVRVACRLPAECERLVEAVADHVR